MRQIRTVNVVCVVANKLYIRCHYLQSDVTVLLDAGYSDKIRFHFYHHSTANGNMRQNLQYTVLMTEVRTWKAGPNDL